MIKRSAFLDVVKENSDDYENFCKIKDNITFYKNFDDIGIKCISCNSKNHFLNDCPFIHYVPDKEKVTTHSLFILSNISFKIKKTNNKQKYLLPLDN